MKRLVALLLVGCPALAAETMRIAVGEETARAVVQGDGLRWGEDRDDADSEALTSRRVEVTLVEGQLALDGKRLPVDAFRFRTSRETLTVNGMAVRGDVVVAPGKSALQVVNVLPLEDYLVGVLGSEMPRSFPLEALKAQAVAARTYALSRKLEQYSSPYHLGSSVISQVYKGLDAEDPRTREAVEATKGVVLTWQLQPIEAYFHASCGGRTESGAEALNRDLPYLKSVDCPCASLPASRWTLSLSTQELERLGGKGAKLEVQGKSDTGRVKRVQVGARSLDAVTFRERLGYSRVKSLLFSVEPVKEGVKLVGQGFGHGAGLCQWGARLYAEKGWDFRKILGHYYPGTELQTLY